ncbi:MAG: hypothetical protein AAFY33_03575 [Cyanobacteria bacterium J06643_4]
MSATALPQLEEIVSDLEAQEAAIAAQLEEITAKREAVLSVINMFDGDAAAPAKTAKKATTGRKTAGRKATGTKAKAAAKSTTTTKAKTSTKSTKTTKAKSKGAKKDGRTATWQKYTLPGVGKQPMPEAVRLILATQPDKDFKIAEVMSALFKDTMPKNQYLKARNRISNILSGGVRDGQWYKGDRGAYRLTPAS